MTLPVVTDHALLRYLERALGMDLEALRREIARAAAKGVAHGAPVVIFGGGKLVIHDGVVRTVLPRNAITGTRQPALESEREPRPIRRRKFRRPRLRA
jgi:hypothetical protein